MASRIPLAKEAIDETMIERLVEWLTTDPQLTKGPLTADFEREWARALGARHAVFVNSGSSANLLMLYALSLAGRLRGKTVAVPALSWATDLSPVLQLGMKPVLVDASLEHLGVDPAHLERVFEQERPAALLCVSVLGLPPPMDEIMELCARYDVVLLEDACESLGSAYAGRQLGSFGTMASYSLYYGHHLSTIEGGMVCTDDDELARLLKMLRSHGWDRDLEADDRAVLRSRWKRSEFDAAYTFYVPGFNVRPTDLQARIGLMQLERMDAVIARREETFNRYLRRLRGATWTPTIGEGHRVSCFAYPVLAGNREALAGTLANNGVETRPLICGSMGTQPFFVERFGRRDLPGASRVDREGLYVPCHDRMTDDEVDLVAETIVEASR